jgi:hypothetical protein
LYGFTLNSPVNQVDIDGRYSATFITGAIDVALEWAMNRVCTPGNRKCELCYKLSGMTRAGLAAGGFAADMVVSVGLNVFYGIVNAIIAHAALGMKLDNLSVGTAACIAGCKPLACAK